MTGINFIVTARLLKNQRKKIERQLLLLPLIIVLVIFGLSGGSFFLNLMVHRQMVAIKTQIDHFKQTIKARKTVEEKEFYYTLAVRTALSVLQKRFNWQDLLEKSLALQSAGCRLININLENNKEERLTCGFDNLVEVLHLEDKLRSLKGLASFQESGFNGIKKDSNGLYQVVLNIKWEKK